MTTLLTTLLRTTLFTLLVIGSGAAAGQETPIGEMGRTELEQELSSILSHGVFVRRSSREGEAVWGKNPRPVDWSQTAEITARFEGCIVVVHLEKPDFCERGIGTFGGIDRVVDLRFLEEESLVRPLDPAFPTLGARVEYPYRAKIAEELSDLSRVAREIMEEGYGHFPADVPARLRWFADEFEARVTGDVLAGAHERTHWCPGNGRGFQEPPLNDIRMEFRVDPERAEEFVSLMDEYRGRYCRAVDGAAMQRIVLRM